MARRGAGREARVWCGAGSAPGRGSPGDEVSVEGPARVIGFEAAARGGLRAGQTRSKESRLLHLGSSPTAAASRQAAVCRCCHLGPDAPAPPHSKKLPPHTKQAG